MFREATREPQQVLEHRGHDGALKLFGTHGLARLHCVTVIAMMLLVFVAALLKDRFSFDLAHCRYRV